MVGLAVLAGDLDYVVDFEDVFKGDLVVVE